METTNSLSSGRKTRYCPPADEVSVKPSSRPIMSSWSRWPLLEKNRLPATSSKLCLRPLLSTSRTHSPSRSGPRWTPDQASAGTSAGSSVERSDMAQTLVAGAPIHSAGGVGPERPVDVGGREHAVDAAVVLDEEVLLRGPPADG